MVNDRLVSLFPGHLILVYLVITYIATQDIYDMKLINVLRISTSVHFKSIIKEQRNIAFKLGEQYN